MDCRTDEVSYVLPRMGGGEEGVGGSTRVAVTTFFHKYLLPWCDTEIYGIHLIWISIILYILQCDLENNEMTRGQEIFHLGSRIF